MRNGESGSSVSMLVGSRRNRRGEGVGVVLDQLREQVADVVGLGDQARADPADHAAAQVRAAVRGRQEDDPLDERQGLEEQVTLQLVEDLGRRR